MKSIDSVMYHVQYFITQCTVSNHYREAVISNVWYKTNINFTVIMFVLLKCYCTFTSITEKSWEMIEIKHNTIFNESVFFKNILILDDYLIRNKRLILCTLCYYFIQFIYFLKTFLVPDIKSLGISTRFIIHVSIIYKNDSLCKRFKRFYQLKGQ